MHPRLKTIIKPISKVARKTFDMLDDRVLSQSFQERKEIYIEGKIASRKAAKRYAKNFGLSPIDDVDMRIKHILNEKIITEVKRRKLTHLELAIATRTSRPAITRILNRNLHEASIEFLLRILCILEIHTDISFRS